MREERACSNEECTKSDCSGCKERADHSFLAETNPFTEIKKVIAVMSGKGGVGKSTVTALLASYMAQKGYKTGILDADITGPSIPKMFGIKGPVGGSDELIAPTVTESGIRVISLNLLMDDEESPVIWRGPVIAGMVKQFWTDVMWGDLDYLFVDMPPGTGDVPLTVFQSLPVDGAILITSPQDLVKMIVKKAYNMADKMNIPILGVIENYSYFKCPDCGKEHPIFGESHIEKVASEMGLSVLGRLPIIPQVAAAADAGKIDALDEMNVDKPDMPEAVSMLEKLLKG